MDENKENRAAANETTEEKRLLPVRVVFDSATPSTLSIIRVVVITIILLGIADFAKSILSSLVYLFFMIVLAVFFAYLIEPLVKMIRRPFEKRYIGKYMPRSLAIGIAYVLVFGILSISIAYLAPLISAQGRQFAERAPTYTSSMQEQINNLNRRLDRMSVSENLQKQINERIDSSISEIGNYIAEFVRGAAAYVPWLILVPILAFFFLKDANFFRIGILRVFPAGRWRMRMESVLADINDTLAAYVRAQLISCVIIGIICTAGFYLLGNNYAILLGILAGVFEFVPLIGPLTIGIAATIVAGFESGWGALWTAIFLGVLRIVHDYVTYPRIIREGIHLHPLAIILSVLAGEQVAGIPGVFLSIPIVALLTVFYKHVLEHMGSKGFFVGLLEPKENAEENKEAEIV